MRCCSSRGRNAVCCGRWRLSGGRILAWFLASCFLTAVPELRAEVVSFPSISAASSAATTNQSLVFLVFGAEWCGPCKLLDRAMASAEFQNGAGALQFVHVDIDADEKTARLFDVSSIPDMVLLSADGKIIARQTGFQNTTNLLAWIEVGRRRLAAGQWDGGAAGGEIRELAGKAAGSGLATNELQQLIGLLADRDPAQRNAAVGILASRPEQSFEPVVNALADPYLGTRVGASDVLRRWIPDRAIDPWQSPADLAAEVEILKQLWATNQAGIQPVVRVSDPSMLTAAQSALASLKSESPVERTRAMSTLVNLGHDSLPTVRDALRKAEIANDSKLAGYLEDVRWAILISDSVETRTGGVRLALARGRTADRQAAAVKLARVGREGLAALGELTSDNDPLVVESAVRALSGVGGKGSVPAMAALLNAADSNLRMTAAQALGKSKSSEAVTALLPVFEDADETVACTALAAVEQLFAESESRVSSTKPEVIAALKKRIEDSRWRVRAAATEVAGKLSATELAGALKKLLRDTDQFVVRNTLVALSKLNATPDARQLKELSDRLPSLRLEIVGMLMASHEVENVTAVSGIFEAAETSQQAAILNLLIRISEARDGEADRDWKPLLTKALGSGEVRVRRAAAEALGQRSFENGAPLLEPLLRDTDSATRQAAAGSLLSLVAAASVEKKQGAAVVSLHKAAAVKTNELKLTPELRSRWHAALRENDDFRTNFLSAVAFFVTSEDATNVAMLNNALASVNESTREAFASSRGAGVLLSKLTWPSAEPFLKAFCSDPKMLVLAAKESMKAQPEVKAFVLDRDRFVRTIETVSEAETPRLLQPIGGYAFDAFAEVSGWSLVAATPESKAIAAAMASSSNTVVRAIGVFATGLNRSEPDRVKAALNDADARVRKAAVQGLIRSLKKRAEVEASFGPLVNDRDRDVARMAAWGLLEPEIRSAVIYSSTLDYFQLGEFMAGGSSTHFSASDRPIYPVDSKPEYLKALKTLLTNSDLEDGAAFALLLAQHAEPEGIDWLSRKFEAADEANSTLERALLMAIQLSRETKHLPSIRKMLQSRTEESEVRELLRPLRGMGGAEARQLRLEINRKLRQLGGTSASLD